MYIIPNSWLRETFVGYNRGNGENRQTQARQTVRVRNDEREACKGALPQVRSQRRKAGTKGRCMMETLVLTEIIRRLYVALHTGKPDPEAMSLAADLLRPALQKRPELLKECGL